MNETVSIIIPARFASTRFEGKPLAPLRGATGVSKTLIQRTWELANQVENLDAVYVATDDERIAKTAEGFGARVLMTSSDCLNGTERVAEAVRSYAIESSIIVNLQGDAPLTPPWFLSALIDEMKQDPSVQMATPVLRCKGKALNNFLDDLSIGRVGGTTAVFSKNREALYFSKQVIPYTEKRYQNDEDTPVFHHVGAYAYRQKALENYIAWGEGLLEHLEGLEQLRFMENGVPVRCVEVDAFGQGFWELNNPVDTDRIEAELLKRGEI